MKYLIIAVCIIIIVVSFAAVIVNVCNQLKGKCSCNCSSCKNRCEYTSMNKPCRKKR